METKWKKEPPSVEEVQQRIAAGLPREFWIALSDGTKTAWSVKIVDGAVCVGALNAAMTAQWGLLFGGWCQTPEEQAAAAAVIQAAREVATKHAITNIFGCHCNICVAVRAYDEIVKG